MSEIKKSTQLFAKLALLLAALIWGGSFVILKTALDNIPMFYIFTMRFLGGTLLLSLVFIKSFKNFNKSYIGVSILIGATLFMAYVVQTIGLDNTSPGNNAFLTAVYCVLVPIINWMFTREKPNKYNLIASICCLIGIGCISLTSDLTIGLGDGITLVSSIFYALHIVFMTYFGKDKDPILLTILQFFVAGILNLICALIFEQPPVIGTDSIFQLVYLIVFATCVALVCQNVGLKYTSPAAGSILLSLESVFGVIISIIFYTERPEPKAYIGFVLIFISVVISETKLSFLKKKDKANLNKAK